MIDCNYMITAYYEKVKDSIDPIEKLANIVAGALGSKKYIDFYKKEVKFDDNMQVLIDDYNKLFN